MTMDKIDDAIISFLEKFEKFFLPENCKMDTPTKKQLVRLYLLSLVVVGTIYLIQGVYKSRYEIIIQPPNSTVTIWQIWFVIPLFYMALTEEYLLRVLPWKLFRKRIPFWVMLIVFTVLDVAVHYPNVTYANTMGWLMYTNIHVLSGGAIVYVFLRNGTSSSCFYHWAYNVNILIVTIILGLL